MIKPTSILILILALIFTVPHQTSVHAGTTITVTTTLDDFMNNGNCSLREAIQAANTDSTVDACPAGSGPDIISLPAGIYTLQRGGRNEDLNATGDLDIRSSLTISGGDRNTTIIDANGIDRVLHILLNTTQVTLYNLTVTGGANEATTIGGPAYSGGGIQVFTSQLTMNQVTVTGNTTTSSGGGVYNNGGTVYLFFSTIISNTAVNPEPNITAQGGGIYNNGSLYISDSMILDNTVDNTAGGVYSSFYLSITSSTISNNTAGTNGGGLYIIGGTADIVNSTISHNKAISYLGGGIWVYYEQVPVLNISHSTILGNIAGMGGGIYNTHQQARPIPAQPNQNHNIFIKNSIVANNEAAMYQNCGTSSQAELPLSNGFNLDTGLTCGFADPTDLVDLQPLLGPLQDNGGQTWTHALKSGSPAIGAADCTTVGGVAISADQRATPRPQPAGGACDMGAYEHIPGSDADISLTKTGESPFAVVGGPITYTIGISNLGPNPVTNLVLTDTLPAGVTYDSYSGSGWACSQVNSQVICSRSSLAVGSAPDILLYTTAPLATGWITNTATVAANLLDPDLANNTGTARTLIESINTPHADLQVTQTDFPDPVYAGGVLTYTSSITNLGPDPAVSIQVTNTLPADSALIGWHGTGWACTNAASLVTCSLASLEPTATSELTFQVLAPASQGSAVNTIQVASGIFDPDTGNNSASTTTTVDPLPPDQTDLQIVITDGQASATPGEWITYTVTVTNLGPLAVNNASVGGSLPGSITGANWQCTSIAGQCGTKSGLGNIQTLVNLPVGATAAIIQSGTILPGSVGDLTATTSITPPPDVSDSVPANNTASDSTTLVPAADISLAVDPSSTSVTSGHPVTLTISLVNHGPSTATGIGVVAQLPAGLVFQNSGPGCGLAGNQIQCTAAQVPPAGNLVWSFVVLVDTAGEHSVSFSAASQAADSVPANNTSQLTLTGLDPRRFLYLPHLSR